MQPQGHIRHLISKKGEERVWEAISISDWSGEFLNSKGLLSAKLIHGLCDFIAFYLSVILNYQIILYL